MIKFSLLEQIVLILFLSSGLSFFLYQLILRLKIVLTGKSDFTTDQLPDRLKRVFDEVILHKKVAGGGRKYAGIMHALVMYGFIFFGLITINHFLMAFGLYLFNDTFRLWYFRILGGPWAFFCSFGILALAYRRFVIKPKALGKFSATSAVVTVFIVTLMVTYLIDELHLLKNPIAYKVNWWIHSGVIGGFLFLIPKSKHMHLVLSPFNIFLRPFEIPNHPAIPIDLEASEEELDNLLLDLSRLSKDQALDIFTCVECGRCTDVCPANRGGGILDPKYHFILDLKQPMLESGDANVVDKINVEAGWECTTCQACTEVCPVGNHVEKADEIRSFQVLAEGDVPQEYQKLLRNLQETGNTEGASSSELLKQLPAYTSDKELVLWLGCFAKHAMDPNFIGSVKNFTKILDSAGVTYGVLSNEQCSGDPANKLGDKLTYQLLMDQNVEELNKVKNVTTMCPHCVVNLQKEYSKYHEIKYEVKHHTQVISELLEQGKIDINPGSLEKVTYHDPCNLSRTLDEVSAPRNAIKAAAPEFFELEESGKETLCCGAGGALWWKKDSGEGRTHLLRAEQVIESKTDTVVTGCNFCYGMMNQGVGPLTPAGQEPIKVKDVADIVAENLS
ncbi:(Fe-S)-binding protein [Candidatus Marinimicrobia bacterium]|jgi:Fe-S oxidoreductase|nr:heterodisulfide reductase-related iron-sulfur binding cluster [Candidatus Neomarinimicrobiota bacterium]MDA9841335.1 heterodisulfide reductase-related iron-sulfur binding cluster [Candidatus Neomarinimicrobiota bacterium]MDB3979854.1 heterodisulfide reductase-related iron-sulfur binding cluster [Candidatus Neomarinimicrobiota bacterium]MDC0593894.1 heterodisulfide reductase-related iron-sulfur binding cluster [Candidatus Neomarinimicrobiota bacterium]MDC0878394.1 (Fe-S)-binding protein [Cand|tara:strand:+ start:1105 stop:2958 length:1854 start_codon:yes stop_codon:yes gene_type:complete